MTDMIKVKTSVTYFDIEEIDLDDWADDGYESKDIYKDAVLETAIEYWDISNNTAYQPIVTVELIDET